MNNERKLILLRGLTKTAVATLTAGRPGPPGDTAVKPTVQKNAEGVAINNANTIGQRLLAPPPPAMSGKGRKQVVSAKPLQAPKSVKSFGIGTTKIGSAQKKRLLVNALMEKRANRLKALWNLGTKAVKYMAPATKNPAVPKMVTPVNTAVTKPVAKAKLQGLKKGFTEGTKLKPARAQGEANRLVRSTQRAEVDSINRLHGTAYPGGNPGMFRMTNKAPSASKMPNAWKQRVGHKLPGGGIMLGKSGRYKKLGRKDSLEAAKKGYKQSAKNLRWNETFQAGGRMLGKPIGVARDIGKGARATAKSVRTNALPMAGRLTGRIAKGTAKATAISTGVAAGAAGTYHLAKNQSTQGMLNTMGAGVKDLAGAVRNPLEFGVSNTRKAVQAPHKLNSIKDPRNLTEAQLGANNISKETMDIARLAKGSLANARNILRMKGGSKTLDNKWQLVDRAGSKIKATKGEAANSAGYTVSAVHAADNKRVAGIVAGIKARRAAAQRAQDGALQSGGK